MSQTNEAQSSLLYQSDERAAEFETKLEEHISDWNVWKEQIAKDKEQFAKDLESKAEVGAVESLSEYVSALETQQNASLRNVQFGLATGCTLLLTLLIVAVLALIQGLGAKKNCRDLKQTLDDSLKGKIDKDAAKKLFQDLLRENAPKQEEQRQMQQSSRREASSSTGAATPTPIVHTRNKDIFPEPNKRSNFTASNLPEEIESVMERVNRNLKNSDDDLARNVKELLRKEKMFCNEVVSDDEMVQSGQSLLRISSGMWSDHFAIVIDQKAYLFPRCKQGTDGLRKTLFSSSSPFTQVYRPAIAIKNGGNWVLDKKGELR